MGTITQRKRTDGTSTYTSQIRLKKNGIVIYSESQTFTRKSLAQDWMRRRELELQEQRARGDDLSLRMTVADLIDSYSNAAQGITDWGRSKTFDLHRPAWLRCSSIASEEEKILHRYATADQRSEIPMGNIIKFALLTARRQDEICRLFWDDVDFEKGIGG